MPHTVRDRIWPHTTTDSNSSCRTQRLPVLYVFGKEEMRVEECVGKFRELFPERESSWVLILYDTVYSHCIRE